jgi:hypothetical protein
VKKLKTYGINYDGNNRRITAATSMKKAAQLIGTTYNHFSLYGAETGNELECDLCLKYPGTVFSKSTRIHDGKYEQVNL